MEKVEKSDFVHDIIKISPESGSVKIVCQYFTPYFIFNL